MLVVGILLAMIVAAVCVVVGVYVGYGLAERNQENRF